MNQYSSDVPTPAAAQQIARDVLRRRMAGDALSDEQVLAEHSRLEPLLRPELRKIALIAQAARVAASSSIGAGLPPRTGPSPARFPGYTLLREIDRGGQGAVYEAMQHGTNRRVAIKLIHRTGSDAARQNARFQQEVQILAQLRQPHIVTIHESGAAGDDCYFVMDFVDGLPLDAWVESRRAAGGKAALREILALLATVCDAVHAAHLRGVIHRDLKPANIRVDGGGKPIVLDFGLAKLTDADTPRPALTESGQFLGSLAWSSPEQVSGPMHALDLRSDVYSLGVILFHSVAGRHPYDVRGAIPDVIERIRGVEPKGFRTANAFPAISPLDRDLECVVLRALAKDPERRYQSAGELAADLRRYLIGDAIEARRDSPGYLLRKVLRRHRAAVTVAASFVVLSAAAAVGFAIQAERIREQRDFAEECRVGERVARLSSERVTAFLANLLAAADPFADPEHRREITLLRAVDLASERVAREFGGEPLVEAHVRTVIGRVYRELGELARADEHLLAAISLRRAAFPPAPAALAESLHELAVLRQVQARYAEAHEICVEALELRRAAAGDESSEIAASLSLLAHQLRELNRLDDAEHAAREALRLRQAAAVDDATLAESLNSLAGVLREKRALEEAEALYVEALNRRRTALGAEHPDVATSLNNLAALRLEQKRHADAIPFLEESLAIYRARLDESHPYVARGRTNLGTALAEIGRIAEAEREFRAAIAIREALGGEEDPELPVLEYLLGRLLARSQQYPEARTALEAAVAGLRAARGDGDNLTRRAATLLADVYQRLGEATLSQTLRDELGL